MLTSLCIFSATAAFTWHEFLAEPSGLIAILALLAGYLMSSSVALWVWADAHSLNREELYDFDSLVFFLWPVVAPIYLFRTRGWDAMAPIGLFLLLQLGAFLFAMVLGYPSALEYLQVHLR